MSKNQLFELKEELISLGIRVSDFIKNELHRVGKGDIETKDLNSLVTYVDKEAERLIVTHLSELTPDYGFITEEDTVDSADKPNVWIIDPLDGTTNFIQKIPHFSISIALQHKGETVLGMVYEIMHDIAYTAIKGFGAWENEEVMSVSSKLDMSQAIVVTGFPYRRDFDIDKSLAILKYCVTHCRGVRRLGSAALDLAYVAAGKIDIYYENSLNIWDLAAGALLVEEAGGKVTDYEGGQNHLNSGRIISSNSKLHDKISSVIKSNLL